MSFKDYYQLLGVNRDATQLDIKAAFRKLAFQHHPDHNPDDTKQAEERFKEINEAYEVLGDETRRQRYDYLVSRVEQGQRVFPFDDMSGAGTKSDYYKEMLRMFASLGFIADSPWRGRGWGCGGGFGCRRQHFPFGKRSNSDSELNP